LGSNKILFDLNEVERELHLEIKLEMITLNQRRRKNWKRFVPNLEDGLRRVESN